MSLSKSGIRMDRTESALEAEDPVKVLFSSIHQGLEDLTPLQAADEIVTLFCRLHGGLEEAMPIVRYQFEKAGADFSNPTKSDLFNVATKLVKVTRFIKGDEIADLEGKRFRNIVRAVREE